MHLIAESRIDGEFTGWTGDGVYRLVNGQLWKQIRYRYRYRYSYRPIARILSDGGRHILEVDGMEDAIEVRRVYASSESSLSWNNRVEGVAWLIGGLAALWLFTWLTGCIVRGFLGIPQGHDSKA